MAPNVPEQKLSDKFSQFQLVVNPDVETWKALIRLTAEHERWSMSVTDYQVWLDGFGRDNFTLLVALEKDMQRIAGSVCSATYVSVEGSKRLTTIGMYFVVPEYRGIGLARELWDRLFANPAIADDNMALVGAPKMSQKYAKTYGFDKFANWLINVVVAKIGDLKPEKLSIPSGIRILSPEEVGYAKVNDYDRRFTGGINRERLLEAWISAAGAHTKVAVNNSNEVVGFGVVREVHGKRLAVTPLVANEKAIAGAILRSILESIPNLSTYEELVFYVPSTAVAMFQIMDALTDASSAIKGHSYVQFTKELLKVPVEDIYCITEYGVL